LTAAPELAGYAQDFNNIQKALTILPSEAEVRQRDNLKKITLHFLTRMAAALREENTTKEGLEELK